MLAYLRTCVCVILHVAGCVTDPNTLYTSSLAGQHLENISSSHGKGKKTKSEFESKVSAAEKGADEQKSALNASENLKREVSWYPLFTHRSNALSFVNTTGKICGVLLFCPRSITWPLLQWNVYLARPCVLNCVTFLILWL